MSLTLVERLINGEEPAFKEIIYLYYPGLLKFANSYLHDIYFAENIVQDAFVIVWEKHASLEIRSNIKAYLVTIVKNKCINYIEKLKNRIRLEENLHHIHVKELNLSISTLASLNPETLFVEEIENIIEHTINELPEQTRKVFIMSRFQDISNEGIATKLNISIKGVEYHISKTLKILKTKLSDYLPLLFLFV
jgi:RNA polymerase sigma-70 factor, ECF subfamily